MEYGLLLLISSVIGGGVFGALVRGWSFHARLYSLENRLSEVEGITTREVKIRAATERWKKPSREEEAIEKAILQPPEPNPGNLWWLKTGAPRSYSGK